jgi:hypothetical protein
VCHRGTAISCRRPVWRIFRIDGNGSTSTAFPQSGEKWVFGAFGLARQICWNLLNRFKAMALSRAETSKGAWHVDHG